MTDSGLAGRVAVVTDSTAGLQPDDLAASGVSVVPLRVTLGHRTAADDGVDVTPGDVVRALRSGLSVSTSRPTPGEFATRYRAVLDAGASHVVSVHLSAALSGTWESATLAAQDFPHGTVRVVDARSTAMGLGFAVLAAATRAAAGDDPARVQGAATDVVDRTRTLFCVDTLEFLRRGGRIGAASALLATSLSIKPLLQLSGGQIVALEKVRTSSRALARLVELTTAAGGTDTVDLAVAHLGVPDRAEALAERFRSSGLRIRQCRVDEIGPVLGAHLGPGVLGAVLVRGEPPE